MVVFFPIALQPSVRTDLVIVSLEDGQTPSSSRMRARRERLPWRKLYILGDCPFFYFARA
jgi:hypothetical protein